MQVHSKFDRACVVLCGLWRIRSKKTEGAAGRVIAVPSQRSKWFSLLRPWLERRNARRERLDIWRLRLPRCMLPPLRLVHARNGSYKPPAPLKSRHRSAQPRREKGFYHFLKGLVRNSPLHFKFSISDNPFLFSIISFSGVLYFFAYNSLDYFFDFPQFRLALRILALPTSVWLLHLPSPT